MTCIAFAPGVIDDAGVRAAVDAAVAKAALVRAAVVPTRDTRPEQALGPGADPAAPGPGVRSRRRTWRTVAFGGFGALLAVELVLVWPYLEQATEALSSPDARWLALAVVAELVSMGAFARVQRRMLSAGGQRAPIRKMLALTYAANAMSVTFPGGTALSTGYVLRRLRSWGATAPAAGFTVLASGVLSTVSFALLAVACALLAGSGAVSSLLIVAGVGVSALVAVVVRRHRTDLVWRIAGRSLVRTNRILHRTPDAGLAALQRFAREVTAIKPRLRDWLAGLGFAGVNWIADLACLIASCHAVGARGSTLVLVTVAYVAGMSASSVSLLPGGFGVVDAAMVLALTSGGMSTVSATAGVLVYRSISVALIVLLGWLVWTVSWFADHRLAPAHEAATADPAGIAIVTNTGISDTL